MCHSTRRNLRNLHLCVFVCVQCLCAPSSNKKKISTSVYTKADAPLLSVKTGKSYTMASQRGRRSTLLPASDQLFILFSALLFLSGTNTHISIVFFGKNAKELYRKSSLPYSNKFFSASMSQGNENILSAGGVCVCLLSFIGHILPFHYKRKFDCDYRLYSIMKIFSGLHYSSTCQTKKTEVDLYNYFFTSCTTHVQIGLLFGSVINHQCSLIVIHR